VLVDCDEAHGKRSPRRAELSVIERLIAERDAAIREVGNMGSQLGEAQAEYDKVLRAHAEAEAECYRERDAALDASGQQYVRAEALERLNEKLERERDAAVARAEKVRTQAFTDIIASCGSATFKDRDDALAAVLAQARADALEEAAVLVNGWFDVAMWEGKGSSRSLSHLLAAIRALKEKTP
jgi:hypothetical protein